jgi:preprotein translocase subunit SecD
MKLFFILSIALVATIGLNYWDANERTPQNADSGFSLTPGWYEVTDDSIAPKLNLILSSDSFFINPEPIVTVDNFDKLEIYQGITGSYGLSISFNKEGSIKWANATEKLVEKRIGFVYDSKIYGIATVKAKITAGISAINRDEFTARELNELKKLIEKEIKARP